MRLYYPTFLLLLLSNIVTAQNYYPMILEGATWLYQEEYFGIPESLVYEGLHINGETVIGSVTYKNMYHVNAEIGTNDSLTYTLGGIVALLREDIENRKVYMYGEPSEWGSHPCYDSVFVDVDYLLYDFNHIAEDTLLSCGDYTYVLRERNAVSLYGFDSYEYQIESDYRYERFGDLYDFFVPLGILFTDLPNRNLVSYCIIDEIGCPYQHIGPNNTTDALLSQSISIFPNPTTTKISVQSEKHKIIQAQLFSIDGTIVQSEIFKENKSHQISINPNIVDGLYMLKLTTDEGISTIKKVLISR